MGKCLRPDRCGHCDPGAGARRMARPTAAPGLYGVGPVGGHIPASARVGFYPRVPEEGARRQTAAGSIALQYGAGK